METNLHEIWTIVLKEITIMETDYSSTKAGVHNIAKIPQISDWDFSAIAPLDYLENRSTGPYLTLTWEKQKLFLLENQMIREASENMGGKLRRCNFITLFSLFSRF